MRSASCKRWSGRCSRSWPGPKRSLLLLNFLALAPQRRRLPAGLLLGGSLLLLDVLGLHHRFDLLLLPLILGLHAFRAGAEIVLRQLQAVGRCLDGLLEGQLVAADVLGRGFLELLEDRQH